MQFFEILGEEVVVEKILVFERLRKILADHGTANQQPAQSPSLLLNGSDVPRKINHNGLFSRGPDGNHLQR